CIYAFNRGFVTSFLALIQLICVSRSTSSPYFATLILFAMHGLLLIRRLTSRETLRAQMMGPDGVITTFLMGPLDLGSRQTAAHPAVHVTTSVVKWVDEDVDARTPGTEH
ncbi:hypothetical protein B0H14DRAFT_2955320, partial [Mycena olivaceomarginata]